eukprot:PhM_4_TR13971/c0_g2_i6/m.36013
MYSPGGTITRCYSIDTLTSKYGVLTDMATIKEDTAGARILSVPPGHPRYQLSRAIAAILGSLMYPDGQLGSSASGEDLEHAALIAMQTAVMSCRGLSVAALTSVLCSWHPASSSLPSKKTAPARAP